MVNENDIGATEEWRSVIGYEGRYSVSSLGRVRRDEYWTLTSFGEIAHRPGKVMSLKYSNGYPRVTLARSGKDSTKSVQVLVAEAFLGPRPAGLKVCHNEPVPSNVAVSNLRYDTQYENCQDTVRQKRTAWGEKHHKSRLTAADVLSLRQLGSNVPYAELAKIAKRLGVAPTTVYHAYIGKTWSHLDS
jgi:hypothetical protein